ncbi:efflux RND transporter periplasmic adaptor subunit [Alloalcanivorax marinus]|uniref:efflux RND transporter periplasmic adaptor subunit n=1 Tax=Alloalcanivorax marinus TaxID=1177169 RepID=UPI001934AD92|nr:efflux RND transporter periplasmic adaptor subunit [Alloalcanivorax marinus]MBL7249798.1 efflux RND transporter periplasmic adaptor subunit [Alloalcanivorax marinus]
MVSGTRPWWALVVLLWTGGASAAEPVTLAEVRAEHREEHLPLTGTITARRGALLSTAVAGQVTGLKVEPGDSVARGDVLLELDAELNRLARDSARAAAEEARAARDDARRRLNEASTLAARRSIAATEVRGLESELEIAEAALAAARVEQRRQEALLRRHTLTAPFDGVISGKLTEVGEWVTPGTAVLELVNLQELRADFAVPQEYFPRLDKDNVLTVRLGGDAGPAHDARITAIVPVNDPDSRTFLLRARVTEPPPMTPGMSARATLVLRGDTASLAIPRDALVRYPDGRVTVWVAESRDGKLLAREQRLRVGPGLDDRVTVLEGLSAGDRVVVRGNESLSDGRELRIHPSGPSDRPAPE